MSKDASKDATSTITATTTDGSKTVSFNVKAIDTKVEAPKADDVNVDTIESSNNDSSTKAGMTSTQKTEAVEVLEDQINNIVANKVDTKGSEDTVKTVIDSATQKNIQEAISKNATISTKIEVNPVASSSVPAPERSEIIDATQRLAQVLKTQTTDNKTPVVTPLQYLDLSVKVTAKESSQASETVLGNITQTSKPLTFTVALPSGADPASNTYVVVRAHKNTDGTISTNIIVPTISGKTMTFSTDKFSTYTVSEVKGVPQTQFEKLQMLRLQMILVQKLK